MMELFTQQNPNSTHIKNIKSYGWINIKKIKLIKLLVKKRQVYFQKKILLS